MWYFAYGSNMDIDEVKKEDVTFITRQAARLEGYRLAFNKRSKKWATAAGEPTGAANVVPAPGEAVEGVLYGIDEDGILKLDVREGVATGQYERKEVTVRIAEGDVTAWTYTACADKVDDALKPKREYLERLLKGADLLSESYLESLKGTPTFD